MWLVAEARHGRAESEKEGEVITVLDVLQHRLGGKLPEGGIPDITRAP